MARNPISYMDTVLAGNLGAMPEVRTVQVGGQDRKVCNFSIGINHTRWNAETRTSERVSTSWINVSAWDSLAELMSNFKKGDLIQVTGELISAGEYTSKTGTKGFQVAVSATNIAQPVWQFKRSSNNAPAEAVASEMLAPAPEEFLV